MGSCTAGNHWCLCEQTLTRGLHSIKLDPKKRSLLGCFVNFCFSLFMPLGGLLAMKTHNDAMHMAHKFALVKMFPNVVIACPCYSQYVQSNDSTYYTTSTFKVFYSPCVDIQKIFVTALLVVKLGGLNNMS